MLLKSRWALLAIAGAVTLAVGLGGGCSGSDNTNQTSGSSNAICGNGTQEADEECDDGNLDDNDGCTRECRLPACGDGVVQPPEACDDGNTDDNDACTNSCQNGTGSCNPELPDCGNSVIDAGEQCDDGCENTAECDADCTLPECGDGVVNTAAGEDCEPNEFGDCENCMDGEGGAGGEGCDPVNHVTYKGMVTNSTDPLQPGPGIESRWDLRRPGRRPGGQRHVCGDRWRPHLHVR